jgi:hypothetical protein
MLTLKIPTRTITHTDKYVLLNFLTDYYSTEAINSLNPAEHGWTSWPYKRGRYFFATSSSVVIVTPLSF